MTAVQIYGTIIHAAGAAILHGRGEHCLFMLQAVRICGIGERVGVLRGGVLQHVLLREVVGAHLAPVAVCDRQLVTLVLHLSGCRQLVGRLDNPMLEGWK